MSRLEVVVVGSGRSEMSWSVTSVTNGWNLIELDIKDAQWNRGQPDLTSINWFRITSDKKGVVIARIDAIRFYTDFSLPMLDDKHFLSVSNSKLELEVYPNPATDHIYVSLDGVQSKDVFITVYNLRGQIVESRMIDGVMSSSEISTSSLMSGMYMIKVQAGTKSTTKKIFIK